MSPMKWMALVLAVWISPLAHATTVEYVHTDGLGSVVAVSNAAGQVIERREYEPYGHQLTPALADGPGYTGHVQDAATGLTYMQQRYFDPSAGRFLSVDPVTAYDSGDMRHFNVYAYAFNSPYRFTDPDGQDPLEFFEGYIVGFGNEMAMRTLHDSYGGADSARQAGFEAGQVGGVVVSFLNPRGYIQQAGKNIFRRGPDVAGSASTASSVTRGGVQANRAAGQVGESFLARTYGGRNQVTLQTSQGRRVIDNLSGGIARESKVGRTSLRSSVRRQIRKDVELMGRGRVDGVEWHFFPGRTGVGPTGPLRRELEDAGIRIVIH